MTAWLGFSVARMSYGNDIAYFDIHNPCIYLRNALSEISIARIQIKYLLVIFSFVLLFRLRLILLNCGAFSSPASHPWS